MKFFKISTNRAKKLLISAIASFTVAFSIGNVLFSKSPQSGNSIAIAQSESLVIYNSSTGKLAPILDIGVDTSRRERDWLKKQPNNSMCMNYPPDQDWGAVFFVYGGLKPLRKRLGIDLSNYETLAIEMKGQNGGEVVAIGLKDKNDPDDGTEAKVNQTLTSEYQTYIFSLSDFYTANLKELYVVTEFLFEPGIPSEKVCFKNIEFRR